MNPRNKLAEMPIRPLLYTMAVPLMLSLLVQSLYNIVDSIFVARLSETALTAASLVYSIQFLMIAVGVGTAVGLNALLSRKIGEHKPEEACRAATTGLFLMIFTSLIFSMIGIFLSDTIATKLAADSELQELCKQYLSINLVYCWGIFLQTYAQRLLQAVGDTVLSMLSLIIGAVLNIILDPIFITVLKPYGLGIEAAAYATVFSQFVQAVITLWYFRKKSPNVKIGRIRIDGELLPQVLSVGVSALLMQILTLVQQTVIYRVAANYGGENSQILLGAALRFWNFSFVPLWGISQGFQPAAGTNYGAKEYDRVKTLTRVFIAAATILSLVFYIPAELFPGKVLSMFITTPGVAVSGATNFRIMFSTYILQGSFLIAVTLFQSLGKANKATWLVLFRQIILFIPLCIVLPMVGGMGIRGVWLAIALTDAILVVITVLMMLSEFRKMPGTNGIKQ